MLAQIMSSVESFSPKGTPRQLDTLPKSPPLRALIILKQVLSINNSYKVFFKVRAYCIELLSPLCSASGAAYLRPPVGTTEPVSSRLEVLPESRRLGVFSWGENFNFGSKK